MIDMISDCHLNIPGSDSVQVSASEPQGKRVIIADRGSLSSFNDLRRVSSDQDDLPMPVWGVVPHANVA